MKEVVLLDLDGVITNFIGSASEVFNVDLYSVWPNGESDICNVLNISIEKFWEEIDNYGQKFWEDMKPYPWAKEFYSKLDKNFDVYFCSTPSQNPQSVSGKIIWLNRFLNKTVRNYIFTPYKHLLASPSITLIDDTNYNIEKFSKNNGFGILFPQKWNKNYNIKNKIQFVLDQLGIE